MPEVRPETTSRRLIASALRGSERAQIRSPAMTWSSSPTRSSPRPRAGSAHWRTSTPARGRCELAAQHGKDPRHVQVVLDESRRAAARRARRADLRHPARIRVRERRRRRVKRSGDRTRWSCSRTDPDASARRIRAGSEQPARDRARGRDHRLVRAGLAARAVRRRDRLRRASRRWRTGAAGPTPPAASCRRPGSRSPTSSPPRPTSRAPRTARSRWCSSAAPARHVTARRRPGRRGADPARGRGPFQVGLARTAVTQERA